MTPQELDLIRHAIHEKSCVAATYRGHHREFCPHALGHSDEGQYNVLAYQYGGGSETTLPPGGAFLCLDAHQISGVSLISGTWHTGPHHIGTGSCITKIEVGSTH